MNNHRGVVFGCGGHARSIVDVLVDNQYSNPILIIDDNAEDGETLYSYEVGRIYEAKKNDEVFFAIGDNLKRKTIYENYVVSNGEENVMTVVAKDAYIGLDVQIGKGTYVAHNAFLGPDVKIGKNSIINTYTVIEHETVVGANTHIAPNAVLCGRCFIGDNVFIGAGSTVIDRLCICSDVIVGAGSVVVENICEPGVYVGNPARKVK